MGEFFSKLLSNDFMPHSMCFLGDPIVLWLQVGSDSVIALAYYLIPILLFRFSRQRRDISFKWIFLAFAMFILACGTSHLLGAVTVFNPVYRLEGTMKALTALASVSTLVLLIPTIPALVALPSPSVLESANRRLASEIEDRCIAEAAVRRLNEELEERVTARTAELERALMDLRAEMKRREDLEKQLVQSQKMEAIGRLAGGIAHDFNNLLTVILGYNEGLREQCASQPEALEGLREVHQAAKRASALTQQLLAFSRQQPAVIRVVDLNEAVRNTEKMLRRLIGEDVELVLNLADHLPCIKTDPSHIDQILLNLAVNARDAMPTGGTLSIDTVSTDLDQQYASGHPGITPGPHVMLAVGDTGTGMDEMTKARVFEPFFTTKEQGRGTGLGLSIVYGIVKQNGGEILVYSEIGHGTDFKIFFPAVAAPPEQGVEAVRTVPASPGGETILLVEDDSQVRNLTRSMLSQQGYRVLACASPGEAQQVIREHPGEISLLLTDVVMPGMRGTELAAWARSAEPQLRVLLMSGYTEGSVVSQGMLVPKMQLLRKPFTAHELGAKVLEALSGATGQSEG